MKLYALLIGINEYSPQSVRDINRLYACENDVNAIKDFLNQYYKLLMPEDKQILMLLNADATRQNVVNGFKKHLTQATAEDVVLIYYSGHGSTGITAPEFQKYTSDKEEQTWVLYDSRTPQGNDLADKEIALLLEEVGHKNPHITLISDSCHAGSISRDISEGIFKIRCESADNQQRTLASYLDGAYLRRPDLNIPEPAHIAFGACDRTEKAIEGHEHGVFTEALLEVLDNKMGELHYTELFVQLQATMQSIHYRQTPQIEPYGGFNPRQGFLGQKVDSGKLKRERIAYNVDKKAWKIQLGSSKGIESDFDKPIPVKVYDAYEQGNYVGEVFISSLGLSTSFIDSRGVLNDTSISYWGEPATMPLVPFFIYADSLTREWFKQAFDDISEASIYLTDKPQATSFELKMDANIISLHDRYNQSKILEFPKDKENSVSEMMDSIKHIARWQRVLSLQNSKTRIDPSMLDLRISFLGLSKEYALDGKTITLDYENEIDFDIKFKNNYNRDLYVALFYQSPDYGIVNMFYDTQSIKSGSDERTLNTNPDYRGFALDDGQDETIDTFKLVVSTDPIIITDFLLPPLEIRVQGKSISGSKGLRSVAPDWLTKTATIRLVRKGSTVVGKETIDLGKGVSIKTHPSFTSRLNTAALMPKTKGIEALPISRDYFIKNDNFEIVNLKDTQDDERIFELTDISNKVSLKQEPLQIVIDPQNTEGVMLPFFFDGKDLLPVGDMTVDENGRLVFAINQIPNDISVLQTRSPGRAIRMVFCKFVNPIWHIGETHLLRWVDYTADAERKTTDIAAKVGEAKKILLLVHGIIGDTKDMAQTFKMAVDKKDYDLVLTYDYENLNTSIEDNARILKEKLIAIGINQNDNKEVTIVAHSMGGLVSRYFIEHLTGDKFIDKLIMAGTPNGGSVFGNIPVFVNRLTYMCMIGAKLFPNLISSITGTLLGVFKTALLNTLGQMNPDSSFIKNLAHGNPPSIPYIVIAGNLHDFLKEANELSLIDKAEAQVGNIAYKQTPNDIAVSIDSVFAVEATEKHELPCHHLNYFVHQQSVALLEHVI
jgi:pimeloyl-ACP methyl ester carboxylesterase